MPAGAITGPRRIEVKLSVRPIILLLTLPLILPVVGTIAYIQLFPYMHEFMQTGGEATKQAILKKIPVGSTIKQARSIMEKSEFQCDDHSNQSFSYYMPLHSNVWH